MIFRKKILFKNFDKEIITVQPLIFNGFDKIELLMILIKKRQDSVEEKRSASLATGGHSEAIIGNKKHVSGVQPETCF